MEKTFNIESIKKALKSHILDEKNFKMIFTVETFSKEYRETYVGNFTGEFITLEDGIKYYEMMKNSGLFKEVQLRVYGFYGSNYREGSYDILAINNAETNWINENY